MTIEPLVPQEVDLRDFAFMPLDVLRLRDSDLALIAKGEEFKAAVLLWCASWHQIPAASLPDDERWLAKHSGAGARWSKVREVALRGFTKCSDGRLYHAVVAEKALESWSKKLAQRARTKAATEAREARRNDERNKQRNDERDDTHDEERDVHQGKLRDSKGTVKGREGVLSKASAYAESPTRVAEAGLRAFMEKHHINIDGMWLSVWAERRITTERMATAYAIAKQRLKGEEVRATYLDKVLSDEGNFSKTNGSRGKSWLQSALGIERKGKELGIEPGKDEQFPEFKNRVFQAAGVTADDLRQAEADRQ